MVRRHGYLWSLIVLAGLLLHCGGPAENTDGQPTSDLTIAVSEGALPLLSALARQARRDNPSQGLNILPPSHSSGALAAVRTSDADLAVLTREPLEEELQDDLIYMQLARDGLVFAAHPGTGTSNLSTSAVRAIYSGQVTNWSQVGGRDLPIVILDRPEYTSPKIALRRIVLGPDLVITDSASELERPGMMNLSLATIPGSIGYASLGTILSTDLQIRILDLDGVRPTVPNLEMGIYPLYRPIGFVMPVTPARRTMLFVDGAYHPDSENLLASAGYPAVMMDLTIGILPEYSPVRQAERYHPLEVYLSEAVGHRIAVRIEQSTSYKELLEEYIRGRIDAAFFGSYTYAVAQAHEDLDLVARPERAGVSTYKGLILARRDSGIASAEDLKGKRFSMIPDTTAADLFVRAWFQKQGVRDPAEYLGELLDAGSHEASIRLILAGDVDAGAAKDLVFRRLAELDPAISSELVILAESDPVPENALAIRKSAQPACVRCHYAQTGASRPPDSLHDRLAAALQDLEQHPGGLAVLQAIGADRFIATTHEDYANLYRMAEYVGVDFASPQ